MDDKEWISIILEAVFAMTLLIALLFKLNWLLAIMIICGGIVGILAAIFKWEDVLFFSHFWLDLDENLWFRILNGVIGLGFIIGGVWWLGTILAIW